MAEDGHPREKVELRASSVAEPPEGLFSRRYRAATVSFAAVMFLTGFAALAVVPILPLAVRNLHGVAMYPLVAGCFVAASLLGGVVGGDWADRAGARRPLAAGVALAVVTLLVSATSTSVWQLAAGRFLDGAAGGTIAVAINAAIGQTYPDALRARALALMSTCWVVPSLAGPPLAGLVTAWWSWRVVFFGLAALSALPALAVLARLRTGAAGEAGEAGRGGAGTASRPRPRLLVALAVSVGAATGQYGVSGWDARHLACAVVGFAVLVAFAPRLLPPGTFRAARGLPVTALLRGFSSGAYFTLEAFVPLLLDTARRVPGVVTGLAFTGAAVAWAGASWIQGRLANRYRRDRLVALGALVLAASVGVAGAATFDAVTPLAAAAALPLAAVGMGLLVPSLTILSLDHVPAGRQGYAGSSLQTAQNLGQTTVMALAAAVFAAVPSAVGAAAGGLPAYRAAFALLLAPALLVAALAARTARTRAAGGAA